jgi:predicted nucleotidyltransferase component of viral defense system
MITQREVSQHAYRTQMSDRVIEKDYVLTWLLTGIADSPLADHLAFKGGTAIKKIYFPEYRYSEDLDFTVVRTIDADDILSTLQRALIRLAASEGFQVEMPAGRVERRACSGPTLTSLDHYRHALAAAISRSISLSPRR